MSRENFTFERRGRSRRAILALGITYALIALALIQFDAALWLMGIVAALTLPALWDVWRDTAAGLELDGDRLSWHSGRRSAALRLNEIDHMRFDTRWDFSVRVSAVLDSNKRVRLPYEALPPHRELEQELQDRGIRVERHHFTIF